MIERTHDLNTKCNYGDDRANEEAPSCQGRGTHHARAARQARWPAAALAGPHSRWAAGERAKRRRILSRSPGPASPPRVIGHETITGALVPGGRKAGDCRRRWQEAEPHPGWRLSEPPGKSGTAAAPAAQDACERRTRCTSARARRCWGPASTRAAPGLLFTVTVL